MDNFNYQEYLRNNPLLKEEVKDQLITEGLNEDKYDDIVAADNDIPADQKDAAAAAYRKVDKGASAEKALKNVKEESAPGYIGDESLEAMSKMGTAGMNLWHVVKLIDAGILQDSEKIKALKALDPAFKVNEEEVTEAEIPPASLTKINAEVKNVQTMAQAILDFIEQVKEKETVDFRANANMKLVLDKLNTLAKTEEKETKAVAESEEVTEETSSKMKVSELKAKIKENILSALNEAEEEVDVDVDVEDEVEVDAEADDIEIEKPGVKATVDVGLSPEEEIVQDSLKAAMDAAEALGSQKLADQIGNTITFFTRQFVVGDNTD